MQGGADPAGVRVAVCQATISAQTMSGVMCPSARQWPPRAYMVPERTGSLQKGRNQALGRAHSDKQGADKAPPKPIDTIEKPTGPIDLNNF